MSANGIGRCCLAIAAGIGLFTPIARADEGLICNPDQIPAAQRDRLNRDIAAFRTSNPDAFRAVAAVEGHRPQVYRKTRSQQPRVGLELRRLGPNALLPMLEALAFKAPERRAETDREWEALKVGMLEAVGILRDLRSYPVLQLAFENNTSPAVYNAAAVALGRLGSDEAVNALTRILGRTGPRREAAIRGLGWCRKLACAERLITLLGESRRDPKLAAILAQSLGILGSSWAWRALGPTRAAEGLEIRGLAAESLVVEFIHHRGAARDAMQVALTMIEFSGTRAIVDTHRSRMDEMTSRRLDRLVERIDQRRRR